MLLLCRALERCFAGELRQPGDEFEHEFDGMIPPYVKLVSAELEEVALKEPPPPKASDKKPS